MASTARYPMACDLCNAGKVGNPIVPSIREKVEIVKDLVDERPHALEFTRFYRSHRVRDAVLWFWGHYENLHKGDIGAGWLHNHDFNLTYTRVRKDEGGAFDQIRIQMPDGSHHYFFRKNGGSYIARNSLHSLTIQPNGGWSFDDMEQEKQYIFNRKGRIVRQTQRNGWTTDYFYKDEIKLLRVENNFGRSLEFFYDASDKIESVRSSSGQAVSFVYDRDRLIAVRKADGNAIEYLYELASAPGLLTGVLDENRTRISTFQYDAEGWATATESASGVNRYQVQPAETDNFWVTDPLGTRRKLSYSPRFNLMLYSGISLAPASGEKRPATSVSYNAQGLMDYSYDMLWTSDGATWDTTRRLPTTYTEASNRSETRTTTTAWHPQFRSPATITEQGRVTSYTYDSKGNPLSQTVSESGAGGVARATRWTYHATGLVATETAPNGATSGFQYDSLGNLTSATNALGHVDTYTHDGAGRVLTRTAPNGLVSTYTYDPLGRVLSANRGGLVTAFTYRPSGQIATSTQPHGYQVTFGYDAAQRLTSWSDNRGNSGTYELDNMGNRLNEEVRNAQGQLVWKLARTINNINRIASMTVGSGGAPTVYTYDNNGDLTGSTQAVGSESLAMQSTRDSLGRVRWLGNPQVGGVIPTYNALDQVTKVLDAKNVATTYTRDALGNATTETSPDTGTETAQYDALGLPSTITDALGQATTIERDLLGRPTLITYADGRTTTLRYDLTAASKGYLGEIVDPSGTTTYERDTQGRVTTKTQRLINGDTRSVSYAYNAQGLLASTTYPGGQVLQNVYDTTGQLTGLTWAGQPLVTGITWNPLGQPTGWSWSLPGGAAAIPATRSYNTAGQLTATEFSGYQYDAAGRITAITQDLWQPASTNPQDSTLSQATKLWTVKYDLAGRIIQLGDTGRTTTYTYDANGNRKTSVQTTTVGTPGTISRTYGSASTHNRLLGFTQTATAGSNSATTSVTYQYNPAGDLLGDGLTTYRYDSEGRMESASTGQGEDAPTTKYAHNGLGQRVFKTEPLYSSTPASGSSNKNLNNLLADDDEPQGEPPGLIQQILSFFSKLWSPSTSDAEKLGFSYVYAEDGSLLGEYGSGGSNSTGTAQYIYLPTASGPMPIAAVIKGQTYAVHSDHLNTPRKLTQPDGQVAWQWAYSAFGDEQPTIGAKRFTSETTTPTTGATSIPEVTFNLRYPGQYFDPETKLHYNYFRTYAPSMGRYTQGDPIGLDGGWNRFGYAANNPLQLSDPSGLCIGPLLAPCLWVASNAPWLITASTAATSFGYAYINGAAPAIAPATARLTNVARAIQEGVESGAYCAADDFGKYSVGAYNAIRGTVAGMDAHHVGQKALMQSLIPGYDALTAPAILVPKLGHTIRGPNGIVSRSMDGLHTPRDVLARDIRELRRVYSDVPNSSLQELIQMNKQTYPGAF
jgi:RHS repeat-associated protein